mgnify:CR=1 FL=1
MIKVSNLSFSYPAGNYLKQKPVLAGINFEIKTGEFVSILGRSGCGKTTLVNILAGYLPAKTGQVLINNVEIKKPGKNRIVVNQENDLFKWLTVWENMKIVNHDEKNINKYLKLVSLNDVKQYFPNHLSGGMKKRLSLARALAVNPDFLILDEPFESLDHHLREELHLELDRIFSLTKKTTLLVTHNIDEAIFLSDRIIVLGGQPASIINQFQINFSHPRKLSLKNNHSFMEYRTILKKIL